VNKWYNINLQYVIDIVKMGKQYSFQCYLTKFCMNETKIKWLHEFVIHILSVCPLSIFIEFYIIVQINQAAKMLREITKYKV
jgi:hypothetical protein